jgi:hypothetical protein
MPILLISLGGEILATQAPLLPGTLDLLTLRAVSLDPSPGNRQPEGP